ncbi:MAG: sugar ABC transporter permease [Clostridia bacterium]|nr:sugar ABC transporter permease [Clostridia bacterium]
MRKANNIVKGAEGIRAFGSNSSRNKKDNRQGFLMALPPLIGFSVFTFYPILWVFVTSFFDYDMITYKFNGLHNYANVFGDPLYWRSVLFTVKLVIYTLIFQLPLALFVAILLNSKMIKGKTFFRTAFYMPNVISMAIVGLIFSFLFSSYDGIVNNVLMAIGVVEEPVSWFSSTLGATFVAVLVSVWQGFGSNMLFFLSGLVGIPNELYEAAEVDGANAWQKFKNVTLPMLKPMMQIIIMISITAGLKTSDLILVLTNGGPAGTTEVVMTYLLKKFIPYDSMEFVPQLGYAAALGVVTSVIIGIITMLYLRMTKKMNTSVY